MSYWQGKVAVVTGGSRGLGRVLVETLAERGARVAVAARSTGALEDVSRLAAERGWQTLALPVDVTRQDDVERMIESTVDRFGRIDMLANCAGRSARGNILETGPEDFQSLWDLNFLAAVRTTRAAAAHLIDAKGHLVNIGSLASRVAARYLGAYPASKFPLDAYSQQLRRELGSQGLHVLLVCPGPIARDTGEDRYADKTDHLPESARRPAAGARVRAIDPKSLCRRILTRCEQRRAELVVPARARILFALSQISPGVGDWLLRRWT
jgi:NAD(P)-dependent dehydrogenase (short-subunit alcohol dehydrogenase family)